jgi:diadenosine tetraphosphate (Ap4A) HIT family hydrolase
MATAWWVFGVVGIFSTIYAKSQKWQRTKSPRSSTSPQRIDYGAYGDKMPHVHFHIVPKYADAPKWGGTFDMMPENKIFPTDSEYESTIREIRKYP